MIEGKSRYQNINVEMVQDGGFGSKPPPKYGNSHVLIGITENINPGIIFAGLSMTPLKKLTYLGK